MEQNYPLLNEKFNKLAEKMEKYEERLQKISKQDDVTPLLNEEKFSSASEKLNEKDEVRSRRTESTTVRSAEILNTEKHTREDSQQKGSTLVNLTDDIENSQPKESQTASQYAAQCSQIDLAGSAKLIEDRQIMTSENKNDSDIMAVNKNKVENDKVPWTKRKTNISKNIKTHSHRRNK